MIFTKIKTYKILVLLMRPIRACKSPTCEEYVRKRGDSRGGY